MAGPASRQSIHSSPQLSLITRPASAICSYIRMPCRNGYQSYSKISAGCHMATQPANTTPCPASANNTARRGLMPDFAASLSVDNQKEHSLMALGHHLPVAAWRMIHAGAGPQLVISCHAYQYSHTYNFAVSTWCICPIPNVREARKCLFCLLRTWLKPSRLSK